MNQRRITTVDDQRRDPEDGAYHCPKCDAPFTRRSNLRRHYSIHTKRMESKCYACRKVFASSEEFQHHIVECSNSTWNPSDSDLAIGPNQASMFEDPISNNFEPSFLEQGSPIPADIFSLIVSPTTPQEDDLDDFLSAFTCSSSAMSPILTPCNAFDSPSSSGQSSLDWNNPASPGTSSRMMIENVDNNSTRDVQPRQRTHQDRRRYKTQDKPIYTKRQVEDMLEIVSNSFLKRMEELMRRGHSNRVRGSDSGGSVHASSSSHSHNW